MAPNTIEFGGLAVDEVYKTVRDRGMTSSEAAAFVGEWILVNTGRSKRVFSYHQAFAASVPQCAPNFARTFTHQDWVDGESVVQASQTTGEVGFNERFHRIESDLDSLGTNVAMAFTCMATMRQELKSLLEEIRVEINRINADIDDCCNRSSGPVITPGPIDRGRFAGKVKIQDKVMQLWETKAGMLLLPDLETVQGSPWTNPRVERAGKIARFIEEDPRVKQTFPEVVTTKQFVEKFGNERLPDGTFVRDLVRALPDTAKYRNLDALTTDVADREAVALKTTEGATAAVASSLGLGQDIEKLDTVPITVFGALPPVARDALARNGVDTLQKFANLTGAQTQEIMRKEGISTVGAADAAEAGTIAKTLLRLKG